jgi:hypothetical protein
MHEYRPEMKREENTQDNHEDHVSSFPNRHKESNEHDDAQCMEHQEDLMQFRGHSSRDHTGNVQMIENTTG